MNLLPKFHSEFSEKKYWDNFFNKRGTNTFEWYGDYQSLELILTKYIKSTDHLLVTGCGNSRLSSDLYDMGITNITNIDISETVIKVMKKQNEKTRPKMHWKTMDVTKIDFESDKFNVVLDKGTLDALMPDNSDEVRQTVAKMFEEIARITKYGGRYVCISLLQSHILKFLLEWFEKEGNWLIRIHVCQDRKENRKKQNLFPIFFVVCTKLKKMLNMTQILEFGFNDKSSRVKDTHELVANVESIQQFTFVRHEIISGKMEKAENTSFELFASGSKTWRFSLHLVIADKTKNSSFSVPFAVFIVPQGRESEWLYGTIKGRLYLAQNTKCRALVVVHLNRDNEYENLNAVKEELASYVTELAPFELPENYQIPFWSCGDNLGTRLIREEGKSEMSGNYVVEDVVVENEKFRRLIFLSNQNVIQSEAKLKQSKKKSKVNLNFLACDHHISMVKGFAFLHQDIMDKNIRILLIGLGGGGLAMYLHKIFPLANIDVVDIDPTMLEVATKWFDFTSDDKLKAFIDDGINYFDKVLQSETKYDVIMLDVDGKDSTVGMSCPPQEFVSDSNLNCMRKLLDLRGLLILNLVCRDVALKKTILSRLKDIFPSIYYTQIEDEVNNVIYCLPFITDKQIMSLQLSQVLKKLQRKISKEATNQWDIEQYLSNLVSL